MKALRAVFSQMKALRFWTGQNIVLDGILRFTKQQCTNCFKGHEACLTLRIHQKHILMVPKSFVDVPHASHFSLQNLPFGVFSTHSNPKKRVGVALGASVIDLAALSDAGLLRGPHLQNGSCFHDVSAAARPPVAFFFSNFNSNDHPSFVSFRDHSMLLWPWGEMHGQKPAQR